MSKALRLRLPVVILVVAAIGFCAGGAPASPPATVSGSYVYTDSWFESFRSAGGNAIIELRATVEYTGTFTGTSTVQGKLIAHADGSANFHDVEVFTGTVNGVPGTVTLNLAGSNDSALNVTATSTIVSATGGLAGLRGTLNLVGTVRIPQGPVGTYSGQIG
jgi:Protein of unknown function (DUF3224)